MASNAAWQPGQLLFLGFEGISLPRRVADWIAAGRVGGVILFTRNLRDPHQVRRLVREIHQAAPESVPVTVAIDQEGGRVQRLREPWTEWPPMRTLGARGEVEATAAVARALARELLDCGITLDFAPVVDVDTNPNNPIIGDRSFAREPEVVARHTRAFVEAMQAEGLAACAKHFPGHGDTLLDSHLALPRLPHDIARLRAVELVPFRAAIEAGVASIMTAHVVFEAVDRRPATLSPEVMTLLRDELGYDGLVFSDDLEMKAVSEYARPQQLVRGALEARVDAMLVCRQIDLAEEVLRELERSADALLEPALQRMQAFKRRLPPSPVGSEEEDDPSSGEGEATQGPPYPAHQRLARAIFDATDLPGTDP